jgi:hypothetical protein
MDLVLHIPDKSSGDKPRLRDSRTEFGDGTLRGKYLEKDSALTTLVRFAVPNPNQGNITVSKCGRCVNAGRLPGSMRLTAVNSMLLKIRY